MDELLRFLLTLPYRAAALVTLLFLTAACEPKLEKNSASSSAGVFVASGAVYAGLGVTPSSASNIISKFDASGNFVAILRDYGSAAGDSPAALLDYDEKHILVLVENTAGRRVEILNKDGSGYSTLFTSSFLNGVVRGMISDGSGGLIISESTGLEKFTNNGIRVTIGANNYVQNPAGNCATMTNNISTVAVSPYGAILMANAFTAASANNRIGMIAKSGYSVAADCVASLAAPTTGHFPTAMLMHSSGKLLVAYSNSTGPINQIYSQDVTANAFGTAVLAYGDSSIIQGVSRMAEMADGSVLISSAGPTYNTIEKFSFDSGTGLLTRTATFLPPTIFTRSIAGLLVTK